MSSDRAGDRRTGRPDLQSAAAACRTEMPSDFAGDGQASSCRAAWRKRHVSRKLQISNIHGPSLMAAEPEQHQTLQSSQAQRSLGNGRKMTREPHLDLKVGVGIHQEPPSCRQYCERSQWSLPSACLSKLDRPSIADTLVNSQLDMERVPQLRHLPGRGQSEIRRQSALLA